MKKLMLALICFYRRGISPLRPSCCIFTPTCSQYAMEAIEKYGAVKGGWLTLKRLLRCNPSIREGMTPFPEWGTFQFKETRRETRCFPQSDT